MAKVSKKKARKEAIALIDAYMREAERLFAYNATIAHRYVGKARRAAMRVQMSMPMPWKRRYCSHCKHLLMPGHNSRVRVHKSRLIMFCADCKHYTRLPLR